MIADAIKLGVLIGAINQTGGAFAGVQSNLSALQEKSKRFSKSWSSLFSFQNVSLTRG